MKGRPIIFSTDMVKAILEGRKTQTRRVVKPQPVASDGMLAKTVPIWLYPSEFIEYCPYGQVGDRLWVRETIGYGGDGRIYYKTDFSGDSKPFNPIAPGWEDIDRWTPSIHMPRWASRITLEITDIRVERVQEITGEDARLEGTVAEPIYPTNYIEINAYSRTRFVKLWDFLNAKRGYGWETNPWVWVISFEVK